MYIDYATLQRLRKIAPLVQGQTVLDVGCRGGEIKNYLNPDIKYFGLDVGSPNHSTAEINYSPEGILDPEITNLYGKKKFDTVILAETLEHLPSPLEALKNVRVLLRPGGILVGSVPNGIGWRYFFLLELIKDGIPDSREPRWDGSEHLFTFNKYVLRALLMRAGFKVMQIKEWGNWIPHTRIFLPINLRGSHNISGPKITREYL